jgi:ankyrin repeat protein
MSISNDESDEFATCGDCNISLDLTRDGHEDDGGRCHNCYWEEENARARREKDIVELEPEYRPSDWLKKNRPHIWEKLNKKGTKRKSMDGGKRKQKKTKKTRKSTNKKKNKKTLSKKQKGGDLDSDLLIASQKGRLGVVRVLLERGADINKAHNYGETPLYVASRNGHLNVVRVLLAGGADINKADNNGVTPLAIASTLGHVNVVKLLLREGADINKASNRGWTPLSIASRMATYCDEGQEEVVKVLKRYKLRPIVEKTVERQEERKQFEEIMENEKFDDLPSEYKHESMQYLGGRRKTRKSKKSNKKTRKSKKSNKKTLNLL